MLIEEAILDLLESSPVASLVGGASPRIYPLTIPQDSAFPAIAYSVISSVRPLLVDGVIDLPQVTIQFDAFSDSDTSGYAETKAIASELIETLQGYRGTVGGIAILSAAVVAERDGLEDSGDFYRTSVDVRFTFRE